MPKQYVIGQNLVIENVAQHHTGLYICEGNDKLTGQTFKATSELFVGSKHY